MDNIMRENTIIDRLYLGNQILYEKTVGDLLSGVNYVDGYLTSTGGIVDDGLNGKTSDFVAIETDKGYQYVQEYDNRELEISTAYLWVGYYNSAKEIIKHSFYPRWNVPSQIGVFTQTIQTSQGDAYVRVGGDIFVSATLIEITD